MEHKRIENLKPFSRDQDREKARKNGKAGGIASGEARRRRKELRAFLNEYLDQEAVPSVKTWMLEHGVDPDDCCNLMALLLAVFCRAMTGDVAAATTILEWAGELPVQAEKEAAELAHYRQMVSAKEDACSSNEDDEAADVIIYDPTDEELVC